MKMEITFSLFTDMFHRQGRGDNFNYNNLKALYDYLEDVYNGEYKLDVIALCCAYSEKTLDDIAREYDLDAEEAKELKGLEDADDVREWLEDYGLTVINVDDELKVLIED